MTAERVLKARFILPFSLCGPGPILRLGPGSVSMFAKFVANRTDVKRFIFMCSIMFYNMVVADWPHQEWRESASGWRTPKRPGRWAI